MKPIEIIKRAYYAITWGLFFYIFSSLLLVTLAHNFVLDIITITFFTLFALAFIWLLTIHNGKRERYIYIGIILLAFLWAIVSVWLIDSKYDIYYVFKPSYIYLNRYVLIPNLGFCGVAVMVASFLSETKYHNIFRNQSKTESIILRILSCAGQIFSWWYVLIIIILACRGIYF
jgi:hypothetical protein